jgi:hypothetical protein
MTDTKELSPISKIVDDLIKKWIPRLGLELWTITCDYCDSHKFIEIEDSKTAVAFCHVRWPYLTATIRFNKDHLQDENPNNLELIVVHELMHIIVNEMRDDNQNSIDHEERVSTVLAKAFLRIGPQ